MSDLRRGTLSFGPDGFRVDGKAVIRAEIRYPIYIFALLIFRLLGVIAALAMEYGFRRDEHLQVPWNAVRLVQFSPQRPEACFVFDGYNSKGAPKRFSLAIRIDPSQIPSLMAYVHQYAASVIVQKNLGRSRPMRLWIRLIVLGILLLGGAISQLLKHHGAGSIVW
jgi:hypothetical protein